MRIDPHYSKLYILIGFPMHVDRMNGIGHFVLITEIFF